MCLYFSLYTSSALLAPTRALCSIPLNSPIAILPRGAGAMQFAICEVLRHRLLSGAAASSRCKKPTKLRGIAVC